MHVRLSSPLLALVLLSGCARVVHYPQTIYGGGDGNGAMMDHMHGDAVSSAHDSDLPYVKDFAQVPPLDVKDGDTITIEAAPARLHLSDGQDIPVYAYNEQVPGPTIRVQQGSTFTVVLKNSLSEATTIHWHGIRVSNANDGVPGLTQPAVAPGGTHSYTITVPDSGIFWYHPHVREDRQQDMGLYGAIIVTPKDTAMEPVNHDQVLFLDDMLLEKNGAPYGANDANYALMGRFGNTFLINGAEPGYQSVQRGEITRYYIVNAANARPFRIVWSKNAIVKLVGGDNGTMEKEKLVDAVTLGPSERAIVDVRYPLEGRYDISLKTPLTEKVLASVIASDPGILHGFKTEFAIFHANADLGAERTLLSKELAKEPDAILHMRVTAKMMNHMMMGGMHNAALPEGGIEWEDTMAMMNAMATKSTVQWKFVDDATQKENMDIHYQWKKGSRVKLRLINDADSDHPMQHPVHLHGQRFLVLSDNGVPTDDLVWKDTVLVPAGHIVDIVIDASNPGDWMIHCHIAEHLQNGMMALFTVK